MPQHQPSGLEIAMQWAELPVEHLQAALKALEPQLRREHEARMEREKTAREIELERMRLAAEEAQAARTHTLYLLGLVCGFLITAGMLTGAVIVGVNDQPWLAALLAGPSVSVLAGLFVLRRNDNSQTRALLAAQRATLNAVGQPAAPAPAANPNPTGAM